MTVRGENVFFILRRHIITNETNERENYTLSEENRNTSDVSKEDILSEENAVDSSENQSDAEEVSFINEDSQKSLGKLLGDEQEEEEQETVKKPCRRRVNLSTFICTCVALCLAAVMLTYAVCNSIYKGKLANAGLDNSNPGLQLNTEKYSSLALLELIFDTYSFEDLDDEQIEVALLKAYTYATGDTYAAYYTAEEYDEIFNSMLGSQEGIGVKVIQDVITVMGVEYTVMKVVDVVKDSPASAAGVMTGDCVVAIGTEEENVTLNELGYDAALNKLRGSKGTLAEFAVYRPIVNNYELKFFSIMRDEYEDEAVTYGVADAEVDPTGKTGIVKINTFNETTPRQFETAIEDLKKAGCDKFVFDVRGNPGGELTSIRAVLSFFFEEGSTLITKQDTAGNKETLKVEVVEDDPDIDYDCPVSKEDIGKYKDLNCVILCNGSTASAAELFVANFRDHGKAVIVGETTFGKGTVQRTMSLAYYGIPGYLKMTMFKYFPPCGEGYDGIGIEPDVAVELSDEAKKYNSYDIFGKAIDNQLVEAVKHFK